MLITIASFTSKTEDEEPKTDYQRVVPMLRPNYSEMSHAIAAEIIILELTAVDAKAIAIGA